MTDASGSLARTRARRHALPTMLPGSGRPLGTCAPATASQHEQAASLSARSSDKLESHAFASSTPYRRGVLGDCRAAVITIVRPRSRMSLVTLIAAFLFDVAAPGGATTTRVWASAVAFFSLVFAAMALWYHTPQ